MTQLEDTREESAPDELPLRLEPMMLAHLALTGDLAQQRAWRDSLETIRQTQAVSRENDPELRSLLLRDRVWRHIRATGRAGAVTQVALSSAWLAWLIPTYAVGWGFGWLPALAYLLPIPIAWKVARKMFERGTLETLRTMTKSRPSAERSLTSALSDEDRALALFEPETSLSTRAAALATSVPRAAAAGFAFGFVLVFLQGLISAFMTPMPTLASELFVDLMNGLLGGAFAGTASAFLAPLLATEPKQR